jgi:integrase
VTAGGARSFVINYRVKGLEHRYTIGQWPDWSVLRAVREARNLRQKIDRGENPLDERKPKIVGGTISGVLDLYMQRYVRNKDRPLRSADDFESAFERLVKPTIGSIGAHQLLRSDVVRMLDKIADEHGLVMCDQTLAYVRAAFNWYAANGKDDRFNSPIVRGMARTKPKERARTRVLSDDEIRALWPVIGKNGTFGALVKTLLLTAQRRDEVAQMQWNEIGKDGTWVIPAERYKTKRPNSVPLSKAALAIIKAQPKVCAYVFPSGARTPFSAFSKNRIAVHKEAFPDKATYPDFTLHDLRRTAKTIMARSGVRPDISERVLGHSIKGVEAVYDQHKYADEKRDALEKLAAMIERILNPLPSNVETLGEHRAKA